MECDSDEPAIDAGRAMGLDPASFADCWDDDQSDAANLEAIEHWVSLAERQLPADRN